MRTAAFAAAFAIFLVARSVVAEEPAAVVYLKDGSVVRGTLVEQTPETLTVRTSGGDLTLDQSGVARVEFVATEGPAAPVPTPAAAPAAAPVAATAAVPVVSGPQILSPFYVDVNLLGGLKSLDGTFWKPVSAQFDFGFQTTLGLTGFPVKLALDVVSSTGAGQVDSEDPNSETVFGSTTEYALGARYISPGYRVRGFCGAGVLLVDAHLSGNGSGSTGGFDESGSGAGAWTGGGGFVRLGRSANLGAMLRFSSASVKLGGVRGDAGGTDVTFFIGWGFGGAARPTRTR